MSDGNWIAIIGIIVSIILSRIDSRSNSIKTRKSNDLTRQSIQEEHKYNRLLANNNINILKQRRSEEAMIAINRFNTRIWPIFNHLRNTMKHRSLNKTEIKSLTHVIGLYESWRMYLDTKVADSYIIKTGLQNKPHLIQIAYDIINSNNNKGNDIDG